MTYDEYIQNPMGKKNAVMANREMYRLMYSNKWNAIKLRENGLIKYDFYYGKDEYYVHFKIPSEVVPKFYYDTIIRFYIPSGKGALKMERTLSNYQVQFYSNDPSFVYTFAHAFKENDLFIKDLEPKMSRLALRTKAEEKNPRNQVGYVKSLYFAYLEMRSLNLFSKNRWENIAKPYSKNVWKNTVTHADDKVASRKEEGEKYARKKKRDVANKVGLKKAITSAVTKNNKPGQVQKVNYNTISATNKTIGRFKKTDYNKR